MTYRELQATRVLSVDAYWQELREPSRRTPREIPVPLWPGESLQQYEREFGRWLAARRLSLVSMREDPVTERNYRLQFAQTRVARPAQQRHPSVFISVKVGTNYKNVVNKNLYFDGNLRFDNTSSAISHHAFGTSFYGSKNESSSCSQYAFGGSSQGSKSEFGVNNYGAFGKNDNYVLSSQIRSATLSYSLGPKDESEKSNDNVNISSLDEAFIVSRSENDRKGPHRRYQQSGKASGAKTIGTD
ncbi:hypothetical protein JG687_00009056 [Phytophthora cactorum]|uniref:Uncharacterized protein n=1 Tax=Phytophthora cactorum TaxID=29920 RepID=A0A8T1UD62_9STRA|nr:hypothetical protein JG687_00009056 [Phytophthora cactorum]